MRVDPAYVVIRREISLSGDTIMAVNKSRAAAGADVTSDADLVRQAYGDALKTEFATLISNYINQDSEADTRFLAGLTIIRKARDRALELVGGG
jgi:hypothetical protein